MLKSDTLTKKKSLNTHCNMCDQTTQCHLHRLFYCATPAGIEQVAGSLKDIDHTDGAVCVFYGSVDLALVQRRVREKELSSLWLVLALMLMLMLVVLVGVGG